MKTACFTGHRPNKLHGYDSHAAYEPLVSTLAALCEELAVNHDVTTFITGGAQGVDQLAFWAVNRLKSNRPDLQLRNVVFQPFEGQELRWRADGLFGRDEYRLMLRLADEVRIIESDADTNQKRVRALFERNHAMVDASDIVIGCYLASAGDYRTSSGGTAECLRYAHRQGRPVVLVDPMSASVCASDVAIAKGAPRA